MAYPLLGTLSKSDFQRKLVTALEPDRKNPVEAVTPFVVDGTVSASVPEGQYAIRVTPEGAVSLHSRMIFNEKARTAIVSPVSESDTVTPLGTLAHNNAQVLLFPDTDSTVKLQFPLVALGADVPFIFFFNVKTEWQLVRDGLQGA